jgi:DNA-binding HxlR family transcriptional regulator
MAEDGVPIYLKRAVAASDRYRAGNAFVRPHVSRFVDDERSIEDVLDTIGDEHARTVLAAISREPRSAKELNDECDLSLPTIYRRLEILEEHDLVTERRTVAADGNHYNVYECNFESTVIRLEDEQYDVRIYRKENLPDQFTRLWDDLGAE